MRQVARDAATTAATARKHNWPLQRGFDRFYGTITGGGSFYDPTTLCRGNTFITPENDPEYARAVLLHRRDQRQRGAVPPGARAGSTADSRSSCTWPTRPPIGRCTRWRRTSPSTGASTTAVTGRSAERLRRGSSELGLVDPALDADPAGRATGTASGTRRGRRAAWRSMRRWSTAWTRASAGSSPSCKQQGRFDNTLIFFLQDNGGCAEGMGRQSNAGAAHAA